jgi:D-alanine-D-alanine ligase
MRRRVKPGQKVLIVFDVSRPLPLDHDYGANELTDPNFRTEADVAKALGELGHAVSFHGLFDDLGLLVARLSQERPDVVFNLCESFRMRREYEPYVAGAIEMLGLPHTGVSASGLSLCKDKALTKKILAFHHIRTPRFALSPKARPLQALPGLRLPVFVKPADTESSEGIAQAALCQDIQGALERVAFIHQSIGADALVEEFVDGRELYCAVLGRGRLRALPLIELLVGGLPLGDAAAPQGAPRFFTYKAKWDEAYRKKWDIRSGPPPALDAKLERRLLDLAKRACKVLRVDGYARVDMRVTQTGEVFLIEVNPNPGLAADDEFAAACLRAKLGYPALIDRLLQLALERRH